MTLFPQISAKFTEPDAPRPRALQLGDCAPGDLIYLPMTQTSTLSLVVKSGTNETGRAVVSFEAGGPAYYAPYYDESVIRLDHVPTFVIDQTSRRMSSEQRPAGVIQASDKGIVLLVRNAMVTAPQTVAFDLESFSSGRWGSGIEFTRWSIEISDSQQRRCTLYENALKV